MAEEQAPEAAEAPPPEPSAAERCAAKIAAIAGGPTIERAVSAVADAGTRLGQTFASTAVGLGANSIVLTANATATPLALTAGAITATTGGTLDVTLPTGTLSATNGFNTSTAASNYQNIN